MESNKIRPRLSYIDCLRGFSMILVVYSHVLIRGGVGITNLNDFFMTFRMPLFFFISGYVSFKTTPWTLNLLKNQIWKKVRGQFLPTYVMMAIFCLYTSQDFISGLISKYHYGYWFTITSFQIYCIYAFVQTLVDKRTQRFKDLINIIVIIVISLCGLAIVLKYGYSEVEGPVAWICLNYVTYYYFFFMVGVFASKYRDKLNTMLKNKYVVFFLFLVACSPHPINEIHNYAIRISRVLCVYNIFYYYESYFQRDNFAKRSLSYIGKHTIEIYFVHYIILFNFPNISTLIPSNNIFVEFVLVFSISLLVIIACLMIRKIIDTIPILSSYCFGPSNKK